MKIDERGQVTIPKKYRSRFGLLPSVEVEFAEQGGQLFLKKTKEATPAIAKYSGILKGRGQRSDYLIEQMRGR